MHRTSSSKIAATELSNHKETQQVTSARDLTRPPSWRVF